MPIQNSKRKSVVIAGALLLALAAFGAGTATTGPAATGPAPATGPAVAGKVLAPAPTVHATANPIISTPATPEELKKLQDQVESVVKKCLPATVAILTADGEGSGIIISKDGLILTAAHVIEKPNLVVTIVLANGDHFRARTLGTDHAADTGMLKIIKPGDYPFVEVGESGPLKKGEWVVALGHPGGYQVTRPPVVRLGRVLNASPKGVNELQTDCTLIMGDSGGPLFDLEGHVVGIHSKISLGTEANLHVPVDDFLVSWQRLARGDNWGGSSGPGASLGVTGVDDPLGVRVEIVGTNGETIGLKVGDIILKIDGKVMTTAQDIHDEMDGHVPRDRVVIDLLRDGQAMSLRAQLTARN